MTAPDLPDAPSSDSTVDVLERARQGDRSAAVDLLMRAIPAVRRWAHGRTPRSARGAYDTDDMVQSGVIRTLRQLGSFEARTVGGLQAYLRQSVLNRIRDEARKLMRRGAPVQIPDNVSDTGLDPETQAIVDERSGRFLTALRQLKPEERQVIIWRLELGYSFKEIAEQLNKPSPDAARMQFTRALTRLRTEMGIEADPPTD